MKKKPHHKITPLQAVQAAKARAAQLKTIKTADIKASLRLSRPKKTKRWRLVVICLIIVFGLAGVLLYKLGSLTDGLSANELATSQQVYSFNALLDDPLYLPLKLVQWPIFAIFNDPSQAILRLPSVLFGAVTFLAVIRIMRVWYGMRSAWYGAAIFLLSAWFLHVSRLATTEILYLWTIPTLLFIQSNLQRFTDKYWILTANVILLGLILTIPGAIWLVLLALMWHREDIIDGWKACSAWWQRLSWIVLGLLPIVLLSFAFIKQPSLIMTWLGASESFAAPLEILKNIALVPIHLFVNGPNNPELWITTLPILNIFLSAMFLVGAYFYAKHWQAPRSRLLLLFFIIGVILIGLGGPVGLSLLIPLCYVIAVGGIGYLMRDWFSVFPRNPVARGFGVAMVAIAIGFSCFYGARSYFIAWPHNLDTQNTFIHTND